MARGSPLSQEGIPVDATDELFDAVSRRVRRCVNEKTAAAVLTDEALRDMTALLAATPPPDGTPQPAERLTAVAAVALANIPPDEVAIIQINAGAALQAQFLGGGQVGLLEWVAALYTDALRQLPLDRLIRPVPIQVPVWTNAAQVDGRSGHRDRSSRTASRNAAAAASSVAERVSSP